MLRAPVSPTGMRAVKRVMWLDGNQFYGTKRMTRNNPPLLVVRHHQLHITDTIHHSPGPIICDSRSILGRGPENHRAEPGTPKGSLREISGSPESDGVTVSQQE